jgi:hypothetical protein
MEIIATNGPAPPTGPPEEVEGSTETSSPPAPDHRRRRWVRRAAWATAGLLVVGAAALAVAALDARSSAAEAREEAQDLDLRQREARGEARASMATREVAVDRAREVEAAVRSWYSANDRYLHARDDFVAAENAAVDLGNAGQVEEELQRFEGAITDRLNELEPLLVRVQDEADGLAVAVDGFDEVVADLKEEG